MSIVSIEIRRAEPVDSGAISKAHSASWRQAYTGVLPYKSLDTMVRRRDGSWWERAIRQSTRILVLDIGGVIAGYATLGPNRVRSLPYQGEIYELYLSPEYQGLGFGKRLFLAARRELKALGLKGCIVWALEDNEAATRFYGNAGGRDIAEGSESFDGKTLNKIAFAWN